MYRVFYVERISGYQIQRTSRENSKGYLAIGTKEYFYIKGMIFQSFSTNKEQF